MAVYNNMTKAKKGFSLDVGIVAGDSANASLTCTGITTASKIIFACLQTISTANITTWTLFDVSTITISAADTITTTANTTGKQLEVWWVDDTDDIKTKFNLRCFAVTGAASGAMTCTGIKTDSKILFAFLNSTAAALATREKFDVTTITITAANTITSTTDIADDQLDVWWVDVDA